MTVKKPKLICMADIEEKAIEWLWYPYIPKGATSLLFGPGGVGKSHLITDLAARISRGENFPHENGKKYRRQPGRVLLLSAEDDADKVLKPNLRLAHADVNKVFVPEQSSFILDELGIKQMEEFMSTCQATVVFIDPIVAYSGGKIDMFRSNEVRSIMGPISDVARKHNTSVIIVGHDRKNKEGAMQDLMSGSSDFVNSVRSTMYVTEDKYGKAMWHAKSNYGPKGPAIAFSFQENVFTWGDLRGESEPVYGRRDGGGERGNVCEEFIVDLLKDGPVPANEVTAAAEQQKINMRTLNRVKRDLGIMSDAKRVDGKLTWFWHTAGQEI